MSISKIVGRTCLLLWFVPALAQPLNDDCESAIQLTSAAIGSTQQAVPSGFFDLDCSIASDHLGLWYLVDVPENSFVTATVGQQTFTARLSLYEGNCNSLICLDNTFASSFSNLVVTWFASASATYYLYVSGSTAFQIGSFGITLRTGNSPTNDECNNATDITDLIPYSQSHNSLNTFPEFINAACNVILERGLWFRLTTSINSVVHATVAGQSFSSRLTVYSGSCDNVLCLETSNPSQFSDVEVQWNAASGTTYYLFVSGDNAGTFHLLVNFLTPPPNHVCNGATDTSALPFSVVQSNTAAFPSFSDNKCAISNQDKGVWYQLPNTINSVITATVSNQNFQARLSRFIGACDALTCEAKTRSTRLSDLSMEWLAEAGIEYFLLVSGDSEGTPADGNFQIDIVRIANPENDMCMNAIDASTLPFSASQNTRGAFPGFFDLACQINSNDRGVWYQMTSTTNSIVKATVSNQNFEARLTLHSGICGDLSCEANVGVDDRFDRVIEWAAKAGVLYYLLVSGDSGRENANGDFNLDIVRIPNPMNEVCSSSTDASELPFSTVGRTVGAFPSFSNLACEISNNVRGVWYQVKSSSNGIIRAIVSNQTFEARLTRYTGSCDNLTCEANTGIDDRVDRVMEWVAEENVVYYLFVSGAAENRNSNGDFKLDILMLQSPINEVCDRGVNVSMLPFVTSASNTASFPSFSNLACEVNGSDRGLWYQVTSAIDSVVTATVSNQNFEARLTRYSGSCTDLICDANTGFDDRANLVMEWVAEVDVVYYLLVSGASQTFNPHGDFDLSVVRLPKPQNDVCTNAIDASTLPFSVAQSNIGAFPSFSDLACEVNGRDRGLWYQVTNTINSIMIATVSDQNFEARLTLYTGTCGSLLCEAGTGFDNIFDRSLEWVAKAGTVYYLLVSGASEWVNAVGEFNLNIARVPSPVNEVCSDSVDASALPFSIVGSNAGAFPSFSNLPCEVDRNDKGLWYQVTNTMNSVIKATISSQDFESRLTLYTGSCDDLSCEVNSGVDNRVDRVVEWVAEAGVVYFLLVSGDSETFNQDGNFQLDIVRLANPGNEICSAAARVSLFPFSVTESNTGAFPRFSNLACEVGSTERGLWFQVMTPTDAILVATASSQNIELRLTRYTGSCDTLTCEATSTSIFRNAELEWAAEAGIVYYLFVSGLSSTSNGVFDLSVVSLPSPINEICSSAEDASLLPFSITDSNRPGFPSFSSLTCGVAGSTRGLWYETGSSDERIAVASVSSPEFSAKLSYYTGSCDILRCEDSTSFSTRELFLEWAAVPGVVYYIFVSGLEFSDAGDYQLDLVTLESPENENCASATLIESLPYSVVNNNRASFPRFSDLDCDVQETERGLWYSYLAIETVIHSATVSNQDFMARLSVFSGECGSLVCIGSTQTTQSGTLTLDWDGEEGLVYYILVTGYGFTNAGFFQLDLDRFGRPQNDICQTSSPILALPFSGGDSNRPAFPSGFSSLPCAVTGAERSVWYSLDGVDSNVVATISAHRFSARIAVFRGVCGSLDCIGESGPFPFKVSLVFPTYTGTGYHIMVSGGDFSEAGEFQLSIDPVERPANDVCSGAVILGSNLGGNFAFDTNSNALPTFEDRACDVASDSRGMWYSFSPTVTRTYTVTLSNYAWFANVAVFQGSCGSLTCVKRETFCTIELPDPPFLAFCNIDLQWIGVAGTTYYIFINGVEFSADGFYLITIRDATALVQSNDDSEQKFEGKKHHLRHGNSNDTTDGDGGN